MRACKAKYRVSHIVRPLTPVINAKKKMPKQVAAVNQLVEHKLDSLVIIAVVLCWPCLRLWHL